MATAVQKKEAVGLWSETFPCQQTTFKESLMFMKRLLGVAVCNIAYLRMMFPSDAFVDKSLEGIHLKILKSSNSNPQVVHLINCLKGVFDALEKKYLKTLVFMIHPDPDDTNKVLDSYTFQFNYQDGNKISIYSNNKKVSSVNVADKTRESTLKMLRTLIVSASTLEPLPPVYCLSMKLFYYDDATPSDYEPPGFEPSEDGELLYNGTPKDIMIGSVSTIYHTLSLQLTTVINDEMETKATNSDVDMELENPHELQRVEGSQKANQEIEMQGKSEDPNVQQHINLLVTSQKIDKTNMSSPAAKVSKRKLKSADASSRSFCNGVLKAEVKNSVKKQSKSKHLKFGEDCPAVDMESSFESIRSSKNGRKSKKRLYS